MFHKFNFAIRKIIYHLFKKYLSSFYRIELCYNDLNRNRSFHNVSVRYHETVKIIAGLCTFESNHLACESVGNNIFRHLQAKLMFNFYLSIIKSENKSMMRLKYYIMNMMLLMDLFRINYVERNEPRR